MAYRGKNYLSGYVDTEVVKLTLSREAAETIFHIEDAQMLSDHEWTQVLRDAENILAMYYVTGVVRRAIANRVRP